MISKVDSDVLFRWLQTTIADEDMKWWYTPSDEMVIFHTQKSWIFDWPYFSALSFQMSHYESNWKVVCFILHLLNWFFVWKQLHPTSPPRLQDGEWTPLAVSCGRNCSEFAVASWKPPEHVQYVVGGLLEHVPTYARLQNLKPQRVLRKSTFFSRCVWCKMFFFSTVTIH